MKYCDVLSLDNVIIL